MIEKKMWYIYTKEHYSDIKKNKITPLAAGWMIWRVLSLKLYTYTLIDDRESAVKKIANNQN